VFPALIVFVWMHSFLMLALQCGLNGKGLSHSQPITNMKRLNVIVKFVIHPRIIQTVE